MNDESPGIPQAATKALRAFFIRVFAPTVAFAVHEGASDRDRGSPQAYMLKHT